MIVADFRFINFAITKGSRQRRCQQPDLCLRSTVWWHRLMLLAFLLFIKMMFTEYLLIPVLIIAFISLDSSFYVLINRFSFRNQFLFYGKKNVYYLRMQFLCIYRQRVLSHNEQNLQNKYLCSFSLRYIVKTLVSNKNWTR